MSVFVSPKTHDIIEFHALICLSLARPSAYQGVFVLRGLAMNLRHKRELIQDGRKRCAWCQEEYTLAANERSKYCPPCNRWMNEWRGVIIKRDNSTCVYCGCKAYSPHIDHIHPLSKGGTDMADNLATACESCNTSKRASVLKPEEEARIVGIVRKLNKKHKVPNNLCFPADGGRRKARTHKWYQKRLFG